MKRIRSYFNTLCYRFTHWAFYWISDPDGDIGVRLFNIVQLVKYKEHTLIYWRWSEQWSNEPADKYQGRY